MTQVTYTATLVNVLDDEGNPTKITATLEVPDGFDRPDAMVMKRTGEMMGLTFVPPGYEPLPYTPPVDPSAEPGYTKTP